MQERSRGFTLIELIIAVAVVAILVAVALPSYTSYIARSNRAAVESVLMTAASKQEQYRIDARSYTNQLSQLGYATLPDAVASSYTVTITADNTAAPPTYQIIATPTAQQLARDAKCGTLTIDQAGTKSVSGTGPVSSCW